MVVIDTSIVYKWLREEDQRNLALKILDDFLDKKQEVMVPDLLLYELANVLATKKGLSDKTALEAWTYFSDLNLKYYYPTPAFMSKCLEFARNKGVSVYDSAFAILAEENNCEFITADEQFIEKTNLPFVRHLGHYGFK